MGTATFELGRVLATPAALEALAASGEAVETYLARHAARDWGECDEAGRTFNDRAVEDGSRVSSVYRTAAGVTLDATTEACDPKGRRACTTILRDSDY